MKKNIELALYCLCLLACHGCNGGITVIGENGQKYESYQECCAANDYEAAHQYLAKIQNSQDENSGVIYNEAKDYVFQKEALFLMSQGDETAQKRIIYLLKEEGGNDAHVNMLIDLAIENDDVAFIKTLTNQYKGSIDTDVLRKIVECLYVKKGDENIDFLTTLLNRNDKGEMLLDAAVEKGNEDAVISLARQFSGTLSISTFKHVIDFLSSCDSKNFQTMFAHLSSKMDINDREFVKYAIKMKQIQSVQNSIKDNISSYNSEMMIELASLNNNHISEMILGTLIRYEKDIPKRPSNGTFVQYSCHNLNKECEEYVKGIKNYNEECMELLEIAIKGKNRSLANRVVAKMKPNLKYTFMPNSVPKKVREEKWYGKVSKEVNWDKIIISGNSDRDDIASANTTLNQAVRSGAFK